jgi:hypothetical protein
VGAFPFIDQEVVQTGQQKRTKFAGGRADVRQRIPLQEPMNWDLLRRECNSLFSK